MVTVIPYGAVIVGVAVVGFVACLAWMVVEVVRAVREVRRRHNLPDYGVHPYDADPERVV